MPPLTPCTLHRFDPLDPEHAATLTALYRDYLMEGFENTGEWMDGTPVADFLSTALIEHEGQTVGFISMDLQMFAVELVYVSMEFRRNGIARSVLMHACDACPGTLRAKAPFTLASRSLFATLGIPEAGRSPQMWSERNRVHREAMDAMAAQCRHKHGHPARPCNRCVRRRLEMTAETLVTNYVKKVKAEVITIA
ncbi:GNAT family N-acetyltransferase [Streptomyces sp. MAI_2237]